MNARPSLLITGRMSVGGDIDTGLRFLVDPQIEQKLQADGYPLGLLAFNDLTPDRLRLFHVVTLLQEPKRYIDAPEQAAMLERHAEALRQYVYDGGGLLLFFDELRYEENWDYSLNRFLNGLDAEVGREQVLESDSSRIHNFNLLSPPGEYRAFRTENFADHPATAGLTEFWWPRLTGTMKHLGPDWQVLLRGSNTASSAKTHRSAPLLLAVRSYGKGRVALFMGHSSYFLNNGYHLVYENGFCMEKGGYHLFTQLFAWLGEPAQTLRGFGGYKPGALPPLPERGGIVIREFRELEDLPAFPGLLGIYTNHSGGLYTVADYAARARKLGLTFLAFTDRIETAAEWEELKAECRAVSDDTFVAMPGVEFTARPEVWSNGCLEGGPGDVGFAANIDTWPTHCGLQHRNLFIETLLNARVEHPGIYVVAQPNRNGSPPVNLGGFNAMEVSSYQGMTPTTSAMNWFEHMQQLPGASLTPVVSHRIWSPDQLEAVARDGFKLHLYARDVKSLRKWSASDLVPGFTSNGPRIERFWVEKMCGDPWERYLLWNPGDIARIHLTIRSDAPLEEVRLLSGARVIRRLRPNAKTLDTVISFPMAQEGPFHLQVRDTAGRLALSYALPTRNLNYWNHLGSDRMNDYHNPVLPDPEGEIVYQGRHYGYGGLVTFGYGWDEYCRYYYAVPDSRYHPQGYETGTITAGIANVRMYPVVRGVGVDECVGPALRRGMPLATRDVAIVSEECDKLWRHYRHIPTQYLTSTNEATLFRYTYRPWGTVIMQADIHARVVREIDLQQGDGLAMRLLELPLQARNEIARITYTDPAGQLITLDYNPAGTHLRLGKGGFVTLWPERYGTAAIYTLDDEADVFVTGETPRIEVGYRLRDPRLSRGREFRGRFLICQEAGGNTPQYWSDLAAAWGLSGPVKNPPAVTAGHCLYTRYFTAFAAEQGGVRARIPHPAILPNDILPVTVSGMNTNWSAGAFRDGLFYRGGIHRNTLYLGLEPTWLGQDLFLGHPLIADNSALAIEILRLDAATLEYTLCNAHTQPLKAKVRPSPAFSMPSFEQLVILDPGETRHFTRDLRTTSPAKARPAMLIQ